MGQGNGYHCTKCDFSFEAHLEVGFAFPTVYKEIIDSARNGESERTLKRGSPGTALCLDIGSAAGCSWLCRKKRKS